MIRDLMLPQLAMGMSEGTIVAWAVAEGALVERDQPLVEIETEKVTTDLPAPFRGYVHLAAKVGDVLPVEKAMGQIADTEEEYRSLVARLSPPSAAPAVRVPESGAMIADAETKMCILKGRIKASGLAKVIARQNELDLATISGTGPGGRIVRRDVMEALGSRPRPIAEIPQSVDASTMRAKARIPLKGMRKVIAERMVAAKVTAAHTYAFFEADISKTLAARQTMLAREKELGSRVSLTAFNVRAVVVACRHVPICNSTLTGDLITVWDSVNVGIAVALPGKGEYDSGLVVPVLRNAQTMGIMEIDQQIKVLVARARSGDLSAADMADGTITVSSTDGFAPGAWGVSTPLLNLPQVVNFQPGSPLEKPVGVDGQIVLRSMMPCGLSFDHRAIDGAPIGAFVNKLIDVLGNPELMLL